MSDARLHTREVSEVLGLDAAVWHTEFGYDQDPPTTHEQVEVRVGAKHAWIDTEIAELIGAMWEQGIDTLMSCQANVDDRVWIEFATSVDAEQFVNKLDLGIDANDDPLMFHAVDNLDHNGDAYERDFKWWWSLSTLSFVGAPPHSGSWHELHVSVRFPTADLDEVVRRLKGALIGEERPTS